MSDGQKKLENRFKTRAKNAKRLLKETGLKYSSWYALYKDRIAEKKRFFTYYDRIKQCVFNIEGICKTNLTYIYCLSPMTFYNWIERRFFLEPSLKDVNGHSFFLVSEVENVARFMSVNCYRRFTDNMSKEDLSYLHDCFLLPRAHLQKTISCDLIKGNYGKDREED
jgi:hypothetical protein